MIEYDVNGDGTIDFDEFIEMMTKVGNSKNRYRNTNNTFNDTNV